MKDEIPKDETLAALDLARLLALRRIGSLPAERKSEYDSFVNDLSDLVGRWTALLDAPAAPAKSSKETRRAKPACPADFAGKSGKLFRAGFRYLFENKLVNAGDIAFLLSSDSSKTFKTRSYPVLVVYNPGNETGLYRNRFLRYGKLQLVGSGGVRYLLTTQVYDDSVPPLLVWFAKHGLSRAKAKELVDTL